MRVPQPTSETPPAAPPQSFAAPQYATPPPPQRPSLGWVWKMAWRDSRRSRQRLLLFTTAIVLGIGALVAINSFRTNLQNDIAGKAQSMLGADLVLTGNQAADSLLQQRFKAIGGQQSREQNFASMVQFVSSSGNRLAQVRALEGGFPFYGEIETTPVNAVRLLTTGPFALVDKTLMLQFGAKVGDSIQVGNRRFCIGAAVNKVPGQAGIVSTVAPPVYIPFRYLQETGLVQTGSRVIYKYYFGLPASQDMAALVSSIRPDIERAGYRYETVRDRENRLGDTFDLMTEFLNLIAFVALLLGCIGLASSVHVYLRSKMQTVAVLRCLGVSGQTAFSIFLVQVLAMGLVGGLLGAGLGSLLQAALPVVLEKFLPLSVSKSLSLTAVGQGVLVGIIIAFLFAMLPLLAIRQVSPLSIIREGASVQVKGQSWAQLAVVIGILAFVLGFAFWQMQDIKMALYFTSGLIVAFGVLYLTAIGLMALLRRVLSVYWPFVLRQGAANLFRPQNQTAILMVSIGLGTTLIGTLYFVQDMLISQIDFSAKGTEPNMVLFDIQPEQKDNIIAFTRRQQLPVLDAVPIITIRLMAIKGRNTNDIKKDSSLKIPFHVLDREYRVSYRTELSSAETLVEGEFTGRVTPGKPIPVSLSETIANQMKVQIGDALKFNVQGTVMDVVVGSIRKIDFKRIQPSFTVLFPAGVLEQAPQFHVLVTRVPNEQVSAQFQREILAQYPNVSVVDMKLIIQTAEEIIGQVSFAIQFMAFFSILTGLIVLAGSVIISRYQRMRENVLLRTLGAVRRQIMWITAIEYGLLGLFASGMGLLIALIATFTLGTLVFKVSFQPSLLPGLLIVGGITATVILVGLINSWSVLFRPPLEILRSELG